MSHLRRPGFEVLIQVPANALPGRHQAMTRVLGFLPLTWETYNELPAPDPTLVVVGNGE